MIMQVAWLTIVVIIAAAVTINRLDKILTELRRRP
jgi:hypothetical protein